MSPRRQRLHHIIERLTCRFLIARRTTGDPKAQALADRLKTRITKLTQSYLNTP